MPERLNWNHLRESVDPITIAAITEVGGGSFDEGCRKIAGRDRFTAKQIREEFRAAYERIALSDLEHAPQAPAGRRHA